MTWQVAAFFEEWSNKLAQRNDNVDKAINAMQELGRLREVWWQSMWQVARDTRQPGAGLYEMYNQ